MLAACSRGQFLAAVDSPKDQVHKRFAYSEIDYFPRSSSIRGDFVSKSEFVASYYRNLAADYIVQDELILAKAYAVAALKYAPNDSENISTLAIIYRRLGEHLKAKALFEFAVDYLKPNFTLLDNYAAFFQSIGEAGKAEKLYSNINNIEDGNPYQWLDKAELMLIKGRRKIARKYYLKTLALGPYLHEAYLGLAKISYQNKNSKSAIKYMKKASDLSRYTPDEKMYESKLIALKLSEI